MSEISVHLHPDDRERAAAATAEAIADLEKLRRYVRKLYAGGSDHLDITVALTQGLLDEPRWDRLGLASVLAVALADLDRP